MSNYLANLAERSLSASEMIQPRVQSSFETVPEKDIITSQSDIPFLEQREEVESRSDSELVNYVDDSDYIYRGQMVVSPIDQDNPHKLKSSANEDDIKKRMDQDVSDSKSEQFQLNPLVSEHQTLNSANSRTLDDSKTLPGEVNRMTPKSNKLFENDTSKTVQQIEEKIEPSSFKQRSKQIATESNKTDDVKKQNTLPSRSDINKKTYLKHIIRPDIIEHVEEAEKGKQVDSNSLLETLHSKTKHGEQYKSMDSKLSSDKNRMPISHQEDEKEQISENVQPQQVIKPALQAVVIEPKIVRYTEPLKTFTKGVTEETRPEPVINVRIGRIEVKAVNPSPQSTKNRKGLAKPRMSLDEYLKQRSSGSSK
jgi:hypothetical protein